MFKLFIELYRMYEMELWAFYAGIVLFIMLGSIQFMSALYAMMPMLMIFFLIGLQFNKGYSGFINTTLILLPIPLYKQYFALLLGKLSVYTLCTGTYWLISWLFVTHYNPVTEKVLADIPFNIKTALTVFVAFGIGMDLNNHFNFKSKALNELTAVMIVLALTFIGIFSFIPSGYIFYPGSNAMSFYNSIDIFFTIYFPILIGIGVWAFTIKRNKFRGIR